jgi:hypothetical protein
MSTPTIAFEPSKKELNWKRTFVKAAGFGAGVALMVALVVGAGTWYLHRPKPPKPWDRNALVAEMVHVDTSGENHDITIYYTIENRTDFDYRVADRTNITVTGRLGKWQSLSGSNDYFTIDYPIFIPARQKAYFGIGLHYPYTGDAGIKTTKEDQERQQRELLEFLKKEVPNLAGFVLFDDIRRYEIDFPATWGNKPQVPK